MEAFSVEADVRGGPIAAFRASRLMRNGVGGRVPWHVMPDVALLLTGARRERGAPRRRRRDEAALHVRFEGARPALRVEVANPDDDSAPSGRGGPTWAAEASGCTSSSVWPTAGACATTRETAVWFELDCDPESLL